MDFLIVLDQSLHIRLLVVDTSVNGDLFSIGIINVKLIVY